MNYKFAKKGDVLFYEGLLRKCIFNLTKGTPGKEFFIILKGKTGICKYDNLKIKEKKE